MERDDLFRDGKCGPCRCDRRYLLGWGQELVIPDHMRVCREEEGVIVQRGDAYFFGDSRRQRRRPFQVGRGVEDYT
jgi:hypothetical protein